MSRLVPSAFLQIESGSLVDLSALYVCVANGKMLHTFSLDLSGATPSCVPKSTIDCSLHRVRNLLIAPENTLVAVMDEYSLCIVNLEDSHVFTEQKLNDFSLFKWHPKLPSFFTFQENMFKVHTQELNGFATDIYLNSSLVCFDVNVVDDYEIVYISQDKKVKFWLLQDSQENDLGEVDSFQSIAYLDDDNVAVIDVYSLHIFSRIAGYLYQLPGKVGIFVGFSTSSYMLYDGASTVSFLNKDTLLNQYNDICNFRLEKPSNQLFVKWPNTTHAFVFSMQLTEITVYKAELPLGMILLENEELLKSYEETPRKSEEIHSLSLPEPKSEDSKSRKTPRNKRKESEGKCHANHSEELKEALAPLVASLSLKIDETSKRLEKGLSDKNIQQALNKNMQLTASLRSTEEKSYRTCITNTVAQAVQSEVKNSFSQVLDLHITKGFQVLNSMLLKNLQLSLEQNEKEEIKIHSLNQHLKSAVDNIAHITRKIEKISVERPESPPVPSYKPQSPPHPLSLKTELDSLLNSQDFSAAIQKSLSASSPTVLFSVLDCLNPEPLFKANLLTADLAFTLFTTLLDYIKSQVTFPEIFVWVESIVNYMPIVPGKDKIVFQKLIESAPSNPSLWSIVSSYSTRFT